MNHTFKLFILFFIQISFARASEILFSLNQEVQSFYLSPPNSSPYFGRTELLTQGDLKIFENLKFKLDAAVSSAFMKKQDQKIFLFNPTQLGLLATQKYFELLVGGFTLAGDGADINNIFDVVNASDFREPFNSKAIGSVGALLTIPLNNAIFKFFYIPKNERSLLPDTQSPWWPRTEALPISNSDGTFYSPDDMSYKMSSQSEEKNPFKNNFGMSSKFNFSNIDLSLFYYSGANQIPKISPYFLISVTSISPLVGTIQPPLELNLFWYKSEHLGGGTTLVLGDWILKLFLKKQKDFLPVTEESTSMTATVENSLNISRFSLRYFLQANRIWKESSTTQELETLLGFFEKSSALGFYLDMNSKGTLSGAVLYNEKDPAILNSVGYEYKWTDQFKSKITLNSLTSSGSLLARAYDKTDNASLTFNYDF